MRYKLLLLIILGSVFVRTEALGQSVEKHRRITRSFKVSPGVEIDIVNKYGNVEVREWAKDSVRFQIHLVGRAKTDDKLSKMMSLVNFRFTNLGNNIKAETSVGSTSNDLMSELQNLTNAIFTLGTEAKIDYMVYIPKNAVLHINNSFGDIYLGNVSQKLSVTISHGDLRAGHISNYANINARFCKAHIKSLKEANLDFSFSELDLKSAEKLKVESKSTNYEIDEVNYLNIDSKKDKFSIEKLNTIKGYATFSKLYVEEFDHALDLKTKLGTINLESVNSSFQSIYINSEYTDITLEFGVNSSYTFVLKHTDLEFKYPRDIAKLKTEIIDKEKETAITKGIIGRSASPKSKVDIEAVKGELKIFHL